MSLAPAAARSRAAASRSDALLMAPDPAEETQPTVAPNRASKEQVHVGRGAQLDAEFERHRVGQLDRGAVGELALLPVLAGAFELGHLRAVEEGPPRADVLDEEPAAGIAADAAMLARDLRAGDERQVHPVRVAAAADLDELLGDDELLVAGFVGVGQPHRLARPCSCGPARRRRRRCAARRSPACAGRFPRRPSA